MLLNAHIIARELPEHLHAHILGTPDPALSLCRPELLPANAKTLHANHLYVLQATQLPVQVDIMKGVVLVCMGTSLRLKYFTERCCVVSVDGASAFSELFNAVQDIYNRYDAWEGELDDAIHLNADVTSLLELSLGIIGNPMYVLDENLEFIGRTQDSASPQQPDAQPPAEGGLPGLDPQHVLGFFQQNQDLVYADAAVPTRLERDGLNEITCSLIDGSVVRGVLSVLLHYRDELPGDRAIISFLADKLILSLRNPLGSPESTSGMVARGLIDLVEGTPVDPLVADALKSAEQRSQRLCIVVNVSRHLGNLPVSYVRSMVTACLPDAIAFVHHKNSVLAFVSAKELGSTAEEIRQSLLGLLQPIAVSPGLTIGVSDLSLNLMQARFYYLEAVRSIRIGSLLDPGSPVYFHWDYALEDMIMRAVDGLPLELELTSGIRALIEHDKDQTSDYIGTLRAYLDHNMSPSATAKALYIHRSTLVQRLTRIEKLLEPEDLNDPKTRLRIRIILEMMELHDRFKDGQ